MPLTVGISYRVESEITGGWKSPHQLLVVLVAGWTEVTALDVVADIPTEYEMPIPSDGHVERSTASLARVNTFAFIAAIVILLAGFLWQKFFVSRNLATARQTSGPAPARSGRTATGITCDGCCRPIERQHDLLAVVHKVVLVRGYCSQCHARMTGLLVLFGVLALTSTLVFALGSTGMWRFLLAMWPLFILLLELRLVSYVRYERHVQDLN